MSKYQYLCLQRPLPTDGSQPARPRMQEMAAQFTAWMEKYREQLVDLGGKLGEGRLVSVDDPRDDSVVDVSELVGGYMIVAALSLDEAVSIASECPGLVRSGSGVEVIQILKP